MIRRQLLPAVMLAVVLAALTGIVYPIAVWGVGQVAFQHRANGSLISRHGKVIGSALIGQNFLDKDGNPMPSYFQPRPSASGASGYDPTGATCPAGSTSCAPSSASNLGPGDARLIGNVPGVNIDTKTNPYRTPADPFCLPVPATDKQGNPKTDKHGNPIYEKNSDGTYTCNPNTVPERLLAYQQFNHLAKSVAVPADAVTASASGLDPDISPANAELQAFRVAKARHLPVAKVRALIGARTNDRPWGVLGEKTVNVLDLNLALDKLEG